jgi:cytochrome c oxidase subunit 4
MTHPSDSAPQAHAQSHPHVNYLLIFGALCLFTLLSVIFDLVELTKPVTAVLVLAVAAAKALCVMMFFMHLKFEGNWKFVLLLPTFILACGLPLALAPDVGLHYYTPQVPQMKAAAGHVDHDAPPADAGTEENAAEGHGH